MSWNGFSSNTPNWAGEDQAEAQASVGDLYILPDPPTIAENPSIGLEGRNEVPLPTAYKDFSVDDLNAVTINNNPNFDASNWSLYAAISNVVGTLGAFSIPLYSISNFLNITAANTITATAGSVNAGLNVTAGVQVSAPLGSFTTVTVAEDINVSATNETADVNIYGASLLAGDNALYVEGGTTLTGGGIIHGTTIGALQVGGIDTVRIDVLPAGMTLTSATFIATTAAGAASLVAGGALALAGGDYISYNSDQHYFINTSAGNDFTDIYVGNIHAANGGSAPLRINDAGRGVELANVNSMTMTTQLAGIIAWSNATSYVIGNKVSVGSGIARTYYNCVSSNKNLPPNAPIPNWVSASNYVVGNVVFSAGLVYRCLVNVSGSTTAPASDPTNWANLGFTTNVITQLWAVFNPYVANIIGDDVSNITIGKITAPVDFVRVAGSGLQGITQFEGLSGFNYLELVAQAGSANTIAFLNSSEVLQAQISSNNVDGRLLIQSDTGLTINNTGVTTTDFSAGVVENVKTLTLTTDLNATWSDIVSYALNDMVERDGYNWRSEIAGNVDNIPQALLLPWLLSSNYVVGNVRYDVGANNSYLCIQNVSGSSTVPSADPTNWSFFQVGSNAEDVWYQMGAVVESTIVGDRLSKITIGTQEFVCEAGTYLTIGQDINQVGTIDATIGSGGSINVAGVDAASFGSLNGTATIAGDSVYILTNPTTGGSILVEANDELTMGAINDATLASTSGNANITSLVGNVTAQSADLLTLTGVNDVALSSTAADVNITSQVTTNITATTGAINIGGAAETSITAGDYMNIQAEESVDIISNVNTIAITGATDTTITATSGDLSLVAGNEISLDATSNTINLNSNNLTNVGTINGYNPPLTIYKNATIGSAISRAANTAEVQVYQQTMTLKANTQYNVNVSYSLLTENASTATPNNNYYIVYRIHGGTSPLTTANIYSAPQISNNTQIAGGITQAFMTGSLTTYTGRFYIRNQNATVALTIENLQASVIEVV